MPKERCGRMRRGVSLLLFGRRRVFVIIKKKKEYISHANRYVVCPHVDYYYYIILCCKAEQIYTWERRSLLILLLSFFGGCTSPCTPRCLECLPVVVQTKTALMISRLTSS